MFFEICSNYFVEGFSFWEVNSGSSGEEIVSLLERASIQRRVRKLRQ
jgi:hypothetical protein